MKFGMIGAGTVSRAIAGHAIAAGHDVIFSNSRGPEMLGELVEAFGPQASAGTVAEAGAAEFVVLAVKWHKVREAVQNLPYREGRILIDATNQWAAPPPDFVFDQLEIGGSELVASLVPGTHVIKAFDNMYGAKLAADPITETGRRILFYAGDDQDSKERFRSVVDGFGFAPVDLGPLRMGRLMQVDGPLTGLHAIRESVRHPVAAMASHPPDSQPAPGPSTRPIRRLTSRYAISWSPRCGAPWAHSAVKSPSPARARHRCRPKSRSVRSPPATINVTPI
jgi:predicted dinucleotide-binding enzyme